MQRIPQRKYPDNLVTVNESEFPQELLDEIEKLKNAYDEDVAMLADKFIALYPDGEVQDSKTMRFPAQINKYAHSEFLKTLGQKGYKFEQSYDPDDDMDGAFHFCRPTYIIKFKV